jgi:hypothetical protein
MSKSYRYDPDTGRSGRTRKDADRKWREQRRKRDHEERERRDREREEALTV